MRIYRRQFPPDQIRVQLEAFDWMRVRQDLRVSRNPAGFLVSSIKYRYALPSGFVRSRAQAQCKLQAEPPKSKVPASQLAWPALEEEERCREQAIRQFWDSLLPDERRRLELDALSNATPFERAMAEGDGTLGSVARKRILDDYAMKLTRPAL